MDKWHLYNEFKNGKGNRRPHSNLYGLFTIIAFLYLLLHDPTLRSFNRTQRKKAKEVGIRKTVGSPKKQLVGQFLGESGTGRIHFFYFFFTVYGAFNAGVLMAGG